MPFSAVVAAAKELRERLIGLGLVPFCRTTGGKGLHVATPLRVAKNPRTSWDAAKSFARAICTAMAHDSPDRYIVSMAKKRRGGHIFLDYLRKTAQRRPSPRSRRAPTRGAPVSMPLTWAQVRESLNPAQFTIQSAPRSLARSSAWEDYRRSERPLEAAIQKLEGRAQ